VPGGFVHHARCGEAPQLVVNEWEQVRGGLAVAAVRGFEQPGDIRHTAECNRNTPANGSKTRKAAANDHDTLGTNPVFKLIANRSPNDVDQASQPTLSLMPPVLLVNLAPMRVQAVPSHEPARGDGSEAVVQEENWVETFKGNRFSSCSS
jgi:hypothetical protein